MASVFGGLRDHYKGRGLDHNLLEVQTHSYARPWLLGQENGVNVPTNT